MRVLIATDGSEYSLAAIEQAARFFESTNTSYLVVSVYEDPMPIAMEPFSGSVDYYQSAIDLARGEAEKNIAVSKERLEKLLGPATHILTEVLHGFPEQLILGKAEEWAADVVVVGSHGRGFWGRLLLGSVSGAVVHHAKCSVLVAKLTDSAERRAKEGGAP
jgi:nucleotide-binding universal stress UspA family protein